MVPVAEVVQIPEEVQSPEESLKKSHFNDLHCEDLTEKVNKGIYFTENRYFLVNYTQIHTA